MINLSYVALGQDLRQHRQLPRPRRRDQRRHRAVRQQGRQGHRATQTVRRVLRRVRREGTRAAGAVPAGAANHRGISPESVHCPVWPDPAPAEHPDLIRRLRRQRDPVGPPGPGLSQRLPRPLRYAEFKKDKDTEKESIVDDVVFEIELIKQVEINVDYILMLVQKYREAMGDGEDREIRATISHAIDASPSLRNKKDLVEDFVDSISATGGLDEEWAAYIAKRRTEELNAIIEEENLKPDETRAFIETAFRDGEIKTTGTAITRVLPPVSRFSADGGHGEKKQRVLTKLGVFFDRFFGLSSGGGEA